MHFPADPALNVLCHLPDFGQIGGVGRNIALALPIRSGHLNIRNGVIKNMWGLGTEIATANSARIEPTLSASCAGLLTRASISLQKHGLPAKPGNDDRGSIWA
jgi:hypothetical protein